MAIEFSFEVHIQHDGRWTIHTLCETATAAQSLAERIFANPQCAGVRVIRNWTRPDGAMVENEVFTKIRQFDSSAITHLGRLDAAPPCHALPDYFEFASRQAMSRLLHDYCARHVITPTELLHSSRELKRLTGTSTLAESAIARVAALQAEGGGQAAIEARRKEISAVLDQLLRRAAQAEKAQLPRIETTLSACMRKLAGRAQPEELVYIARTALTARLLECRSWLGKLELLCDLAQQEPEADARALLDGALADILATDIVRDIIGKRPNTAASILAFFDLADGVMASVRSVDEDLLAVLQALLAEKKLPLSRRCLVDRAHRQLHLAKSLDRREPERERQEFGRILQRLVRPEGLHSGPDTAYALTMRYAHMVEQGGKPGRRTAMEGVFHAMPDQALATLYLCDLSRSPLAADHLADMSQILARIGATGSMDALCRPGSAPVDRIIRATRACRAIVGSHFPPALQDQVLRNIDLTLERFLNESRLIEKLDNPQAHLRDRAQNLLKFCISTELPEGRALTTVRRQVLAMLRMPQFDAQFVAGIADPYEARSALRAFFDLGRRAGIIAAL